MKFDARDKRIHERFSVDLFDLTGKMLFATEVKIKDISTSGISVEVDKRLNIGSEYILKIEYNKKLFSVKGSVVWSRLSKTRKDLNGDLIPIYHTGMRFSGISAEKIDELVNYIRTYTHIKNLEVEMHKFSGLRCSIRFQIDSPEKAFLNKVENFKVKKISLSGMLIASEHSLASESRFPMELYLPENKKVTFTGRVASASRIDEENSYDIGIEFLEMHDEAKLFISEFINTLDDNLK